MSTSRAPAKARGSDDIPIWPDGTWAELVDVWNGEYGFMSEDYEVLPLEYPSSLLYMMRDD